jgi:SAM-dependent methyltransferase
MRLTSSQARMTLIGIVGVLGCRSRPTEATADASGAPTVFDEASVKAMSHALFDAHDRHDPAAFESATAGSFTMKDDSSWMPRAELLKWLQGRENRKAPSWSRTYGDERVTVGDVSAIFVGDSVEHKPPDGAQQSGDFTWSNTLVWAREAGGWKAVYWQIGKSGVDAQRDRWNATYLQGRAFNPDPSKFVVDMVKGRKPGTALDYMMGQGRNAIYLGSLGWQVTGIDVSVAGLKQAKEAAEARKLHIETIDSDATQWDFGADRWDLVVMTYTSCCTAREVNQVRKSLRHGGLLVAEGFAVGDPSRLRGLFAEGFRIVHDSVEEDVPDWGSSERPTAPKKLFRFAAERE